MKPEKLLASAGAAALIPVYGQKKDDDVSELVTSIKSITETVKKNNDQFKEDLEKIKTDFGSKSASHEQFKADIDEKLKKNADDFRDLQAKLDEIAQKAARAGGGRPERQKSIGEQIVESEELKKFSGAKGETCRLKIKGDIGVKAITSIDASAGDLIEPSRVPGIISQPERRLTIRGLLAQGRTTSDSVKFVRETFTNNAAPQAGQNVAKAESDLTYAADSEDVITLAHYIRIARQTLSDAPALQAQIDTRLRNGLNYKEEIQLLLGSGATNNLRGLVTGATAFARPAGLGTMAGATHIDVLRVAALQATVVEYFVDGYVMNPVDWAIIELAKDTTGRYLIGDPNGDGFASIWGVPVAGTNAMTVSNFLAGSFGMAAQIFDREDTDVLMSGEDADNFTKNMITVLAEKRLTQVIYNAAALVTGTFAGAKTALAA